MSEISLPKIDEVKIYAGKKYKVKKLLGEGAFKKAYLSTNMDTERDVVIFYPNLYKIPEKTSKLSSGDISDIDMENKKILSNFIKEIKRLVIFYDKYEKKCSMNIICPIYMNANEYVIITNYFKGMELSEYIKNGEYTLFDAFDIMENLAKALKELHDHNIIHMDLKPANIMINDKKEIYIIDLGLSCDIPCDSRAGTPSYMPPEKWTVDKYNKKRDIWSLGCIYYEIIMRHFMSEYTFMKRSDLYLNKKSRDIKINILLAQMLKDDNIPLNNFVKIRESETWDEIIEKAPELKDNMKIRIYFEIFKLISNTLKYQTEKRIETDEIIERLLKLREIIKTNL